MLAALVDWAAERCFTVGNVEWKSANPVSDRFLRGHGFDPVRYKLIRRIDPHIAGAGPELTYERFAV